MIADSIMVTASRGRAQPTIYHDPRPRAYSTSHNQSSRPAASFGPTSTGPPESSRAAGKRVAPGSLDGIDQVGPMLISIDYGATSAPANALDPMPAFGQEGRPNDMYASRLSSTMIGSQYGSSLEAQTSSGSYTDYDSTTASTTASGNRANQISVPSSKTRLDPSETTLATYCIGIY